ncbi:hypothetical protein GCM10027161_60350 [Microbispora hainanensis]
MPEAASQARVSRSTSSTCGFTALGKGQVSEGRRRGLPRRESAFAVAIRQAWSYQMIGASLAIITDTPARKI